MIKLNPFFKGIVVLGFIVGIASCDQDVDAIGGDLLGEDLLADRIQQQDFSVTAFNHVLSSVQTNGFNTALIGNYSDPVYGDSQYDFVTQLDIPFANPSFGDNVVLNSVVLEIPYYSTAVSIDGEETVYELDSVYGSQAIDIKVYENGYFLSDFDAQNVTDPAAYYSDLRNDIQSNKGDLLFDFGSVIPDESEIEILDDEGEVTSRLSPRIRKVISSTSTVPGEDVMFQFWEDLIIGESMNSGSTNLSSSANFKNYFRGLYFELDNSSFTGQTLMYLNIADATVTLNYTSDITISDETTTLDSSYELDFNGNRANFITHNIDPALASTIQNANDEVNGEERLYLKGGPGSMVLIDLFGPDVDMDGEADELTQVIANDWIINEASLTFYVDQSTVTAGSTEPERVILYNLDDNSLLADFSISTSGDPLNDNLSHLGRLERDDDEDEDSAGVKYKLRLTQHINNVISGDVENVRLGLAVSQNVSLITNTSVKNPTLVESIPTGAAISHEGTVLHGNLSSDTEKQLKLEIYYTDPNQN